MYEDSFNLETMRISRGIFLLPYQYDIISLPVQ